MSLVTHSASLLFSSQVLPILEILYHVEDRNSHHVYMALIILLILTEDDTFNRSIHEVVGRHDLWGFAHLHALASCHSQVVRVPLTFTGAEEHHMVLREVTDGDLPRQFAHPGGHPHHPVQHDSDAGRPARWRGGAGMFSET